MRVLAFSVALLIYVPGVIADSRAWPPGPTMCGSKGETEYFVFDPVLQERSVVGTTVMRFRYVEEQQRYSCNLRQQVKVWLEPDYAFSTPNPDLIVLISQGRVGSANCAFAVIDFGSGDYLCTKTLDDLFSSRKTSFTPHWEGSVSTTWWIDTAYVDKDRGFLHIVTTPPDSEEDVDAKQDRVYVVKVDLVSFVVTVTEKAQPGATDNPDDAQRVREDH